MDPRPGLAGLYSPTYQPWPVSSYPLPVRTPTCCPAGMPVAPVTSLLSLAVSPAAVASWMDLLCLLSYSTKSDRKAEILVGFH